MKRLDPDLVRWIAIFGVTALVTLLFFRMIQPFIVPLVLAAIVAEMASGLQTRVAHLTGKRRSIATMLTFFILCVSTIGPILIVFLLAARQAQSIATSAAAWVQDLRERGGIQALPDWVPFQDENGQFSADILSKFGQVTEAASGFVASSFGHLASGTLHFLLNFFVFLYALFLFLHMRRPVIAHIMSFTGLPVDTQRELSHRMVNITQATLKGMLIIGVVQGTLGAIGFWAAGLGDAVFWGVVMAIVSIVPGIGPLFVLLCGAAWLFTQGDTIAAIGLALWAVAVVGTIDNILRPILVGHDAALHDILVLISTLGGLALFGATGLVIGPVLAGLFVTLWITLTRMASGRRHEHKEPSRAHPSAHHPTKQET